MRFPPSFRMPLQQQEFLPPRTQPWWRKREGTMAATAPLTRGISVDESELDDDGLTAQDRADLAILIKSA